MRSHDTNLTPERLNIDAMVKKLWSRVRRSSNEKLTLVDALQMGVVMLALFAFAIFMPVGVRYLLVLFS